MKLHHAALLPRSSSKSVRSMDASRLYAFLVVGGIRYLGGVCVRARDAMRNICTQVVRADFVPGVARSRIRVAHGVAGPGSRDGQPRRRTTKGHAGSAATGGAAARRRPRRAIGPGPVHVPARRRPFLPEHRSGGLRELPHHADAIRELAEELAPRGREMRGLPPASRLHRQVRGEGRERLAPLEGVHAAGLPRADHDQAEERGDPDEVQCVHCHVDVGHGETTGLGGPERPEEIEAAAQRAAAETTQGNNT